MKEILQIVSYTYIRDFRWVGEYAGPIIQGSLFELQSWLTGQTLFHAHKNQPLILPHLIRGSVT